MNHEKYKKNGGTEWRKWGRIGGFSRPSPTGISSWGLALLSFCVDDSSPSKFCVCTQEASSIYGCTTINNNATPSELLNQLGWLISPKFGLSFRVSMLMNLWVLILPKGYEPYLTWYSECRFFKKLAIIDKSTCLHQMVVSYNQGKISFISRSATSSRLKKKTSTNSLSKTKFSGFY